MDLTGLPSCSTLATIGYAGTAMIPIPHSGTLALELAGGAKGDGHAHFHADLGEWNERTCVRGLPSRL